jgi:hypothetical protein
MVTTFSIGLPNLDHGIVHWLALTIEHAAGEPHPLAPRFRAGNAPDTVFVAGETEVEEWANGLGRSWNQIHIISRMA